MAMACAGKLKTSCNLLAPKYCEIIDEIAERDCPNTQMSMDKNEETIPTAASDSVALTVMCPTIAASVNERMGSETPAIRAGIAKRLISDFVMVEFMALDMGTKVHKLTLSVFG